MTTASMPPSSLKILLAEDDRMNQKLALLFLKKLGHTADVVSDGLSALEAISHTCYQVILMDVQMPVIDGITAARYIHQTYPPERRPYIIALTASAIPQIRDECLQAGMRDYLVKPLREIALKQALQAVGATSGDCDAVMSPSRSLAEPVSHDRILNEVTLGGICQMAGEEAPEVMKELVEDFLEDTPPVIAALHAAIAQQDPEALRRTAHRLRSSSANLGADRLADLGRRLEDQGRAGRLPDSDEHQLAVRSVYGQTQIALLNYVASLTER